MAEPQLSASAETRASAIIDILMVVGVSAAAYFGEIWARHSGLFQMDEGSRGILAVSLGGLTALLLIFLRGGSWRDLGFRHPGAWWKVLLWALGILLAYFAAQFLARNVASLFFELPSPDLSRHSAVTGNPGAALLMALVLPFTASIPEEVIYRGFLMGRLSRVFGTGVRGSVLTILVQSLVFGSVHFGWGVGGMFVTTIMGAVWGTAFILCGRNLWIVIVAHSLGHLALVAQLYLGAV